MTLVNGRTGDTEKLGRLYTMRGKKATEVKELGVRRHRRHRQDGQGQDRRHPLRPRKVVALKGIPFAEPCYSMAIAPKTQRPGR